MRSRFAFLPLLLVVSLVLPAWAGELDGAMRQIVRAADLRTTEVSLFVMDMDSGVVIASLDPDRQMVPASNMKLVTTAAALDVLGPEFMFRTQLDILDAADGGPPDLIVRGDGDPAFGDPELLAKHALKVEQLLDSWVEAVARSGHTRFGRLVADDRVFDHDFTHPNWPAPDLVKAYGAQVAGINFHNNIVDVLPIPTRENESPQVQLFPPAPFFETVNRAKTGKTDYFILDRKLDTNQLIFAGTVRNRRKDPFKISIHDPPTFFAQVFANRLKESGITVASIERPAPQEEFHGARALHVVQTTLPLILARTNQDSHNMFAEALLKRMGQQLTGQAGSWENGAAAIRAVLRQRLGARSSAIVVSDGSGLSRDNRVTARLLVELLREMHRDPEKGPIYLASLSVAGENGTLENRLDKLTGKVHGKSGYINGVSTLSGYLVLPAPDSARGTRTIGFSLLFNGFKPPLSALDMKKVQNSLITLLDKTYAPQPEPARLGG